MSNPISRLVASASNQDNMSKMLPSVPDMDTQLQLAAKMIDKKTATHKGQHSYGSYFLEYSLMAEYNLLLKQKLPGIYCIPSANSSLTWFGVLFIRQGHYQEGVFRFQVIIPDNYPDGDVPKVVFEAPVFHPCIDPVTHVLNVKQGFHKWKRNVNHIWQVLLYARRLFYKIEINNPLNMEAASLYEKDPESFKHRARSCVTDWREQLYLVKDHPDPHYLIFSSYQDQLHDQVRDKMKRGVEDSDEGRQQVLGGAAQGKSYVATGSLEIFSENVLPRNVEGPKSMPK